MGTFFTIIGITATVLTAIKVVGGVLNLGYYAKTAIPFITSIPEYLSSFVTTIAYYIPPYVLAPMIAMLGILVVYLICHLFAQFIQSIPS